MAEKSAVHPNFPDYVIFESGKVVRVVPCARCPIVPFEMHAGTLKSGYQVVSMVSSDGERKNRRLNRIVCETFRGPPPSPRHQAAHDDGDKTHNHIGNLFWKTPKENAADKVRHGTALIGDRNPMKRPDVRAKFIGNKNALLGTDIHQRHECK